MSVFKFFFLKFALQFHIPMEFDINVTNIFLNVINTFGLEVFYWSPYQTSWQGNLHISCKKFSLSGQN